MSAIAYLGSIIAGWAIAQAWPGATSAQTLVGPVLIALMVLTFLEIPLARPTISRKVLAAVLVLNGVVVPAIVFGLMALADLPPTLAIPATVVLLAPCVDYVVVFTKAAGGAWQTMAALTPVLLLAQLVALVLWGAGSAELAWDLAQAGLTYLVLPFAVALLVKKLQPGWARALSKAMDPVTCSLLFCIATGYGSNLDQTSAKVALVYILFAGCALTAGTIAGRVLYLPPGERTLLQFTTMTRNSLIVLPIALTIAPQPEVAAVVVVTQTFVELCVLSLVVGWKKSLLTREFVKPGS